MAAAGAGGSEARLDGTLRLDVQRVKPYLDGLLCLTWGGYQSPIAQATVLSQGALPRRVQAAVAGAWVGHRVWEDGFGNWKRSRLRHTTCRVERRGGHTSNSVISGVSSFKGFKLQRLGTFVGFRARDAKGAGEDDVSA